MGCSTSKPEASSPPVYTSHPPSSSELNPSHPPPPHLYTPPPSSARPLLSPPSRVPGPSPSPPPLPSSPSVEAALEPTLAYVVADYFATPGLPELSVQKGEFVQLIDNQAETPPHGWCFCRTTSGEVGLLPWYFLVSSAHVELAAYVATHSPDVSHLEVTVARGEGGALGLDFDLSNCIRRVAPGSSAAAAGILAGDLVTACNGEPLVKRSLMELLEPSVKSFCLQITRGIVDPEKAGENIMSTVKLSKRATSAQSSRTEVDGITYVSVVPGRLPSKRESGNSQECSVERVERGAVMRQVRREVNVRRNEQGLGIDVDSRNTVLRILANSAADEDGQLREGDVVVSVDGVELQGKLLKQVLRPGRKMYTFVVLSEEWEDTVGTMQVLRSHRALLYSSGSGLSLGLCLECQACD